MHVPPSALQLGAQQSTLKTEQARASSSLAGVGADGWTPATALALSLEHMAKEHFEHCCGQQFCAIFGTKKKAKLLELSELQNRIVQVGLVEGTTAPCVPTALGWF